MTLSLSLFFVTKESIIENFHYWESLELGHNYVIHISMHVPSFTTLLNDNFTRPLQSSNAGFTLSLFHLKCTQNASNSNKPVWVVYGQHHWNHEYSDQYDIPRWLNTWKMEITFICKVPQSETVTLFCTMYNVDYFFLMSEGAGRDWSPCRAWFEHQQPNILRELTTPLPDHFSGSCTFSLHMHASDRRMSIWLNAPANAVCLFAVVVPVTIHCIYPRHTLSTTHLTILKLS